MRYKKRSKKPIIIVCVSILFVLLIAAVVLFLFVLNPEETLNQNNTNKTDIAVSTTESNTEKNTIASTKTTETNVQAVVATVPTETKKPKPKIVNPKELTGFLNAGNLKYESLKKLGCKQLMIVNSANTTADIYLYEADSVGQWNDCNMTTQGFVGSAGVSSNSHEGDYHTPAGLYPIAEAFYIDTVPETGLEKFQVTQNTYWVDDPSSKFYNQRVEGTENKDWNSAEHMIDYYTSYRYGFVIDFNTNPIVAGKGSAIFFHVSSVATAGCVGTSQDMVLNYLKKLDVNKNPYILIL